MNGDTGNVVRLPRDWLGPRDQLIPFGPAAHRAEAAATRAAPEADVLELAPRHVAAEPMDCVAEPMDCTQDDFWGGDLEAIPKPMVGPRPQEAESSPDVVDPDSPCEPDGVCDPDGVGSTSQPAHAPTLGSDSAHLGARVAGPRRTHPRRHRRATLRLARPRIPVPGVAGSVAAAALAATVVVSLPGSGARIAVHHPGAALASVASSLVLPNTLDPHPRRVAQHRAGLPAHSSRATKARHASPPPAATPAFVKVSAPSQAASTPTSTTSTGPARSTSTVTSSPVSTPATPTTPTTSATTAAKHKTPSGPVGQGAAFGPGQLG